MKSTVKSNKKGIFGIFLDLIERGGNALPHPITLFVLFSLATVVISFITSKAGVSVVHPGNGQTIQAVNLLSLDGAKMMLTRAVSNFTGFAPLGTVLVAMIGVGVAEGTGLISAALKKLVLSAPASLITAVVVFAGVMSNVASDAGYVVLVPLGAIIFLAFKRHPLAGMAAAFAGVSGGFSANLIIGTIDPLLGGISQSAARMFEPAYEVLPTANLYFMIVSTFVITILGTIVTEKIVEPRLGQYKGNAEAKIEKLTTQESKGLVAAAIALIVVVAIFGSYVFFDLQGQNGTLAQYTEITDSIVSTIKSTGSIDAADMATKVGQAAALKGINDIDGISPVLALNNVDSINKIVETKGYEGILEVIENANAKAKPKAVNNFLSSLVPVITLAFLIPAIAYGIVAKTIKNDKDVAKFMGQAMSSMGSYIVLAFVAAQFVAYFDWSNLGRILAITGANFLEAVGFTGLPLLIGFVLVSAFINLFIGSASAKWAIMAPIFVPMFMRLGYSPELTQVAYRIGDSTTNIISPLMSYFAVIVAFAQKYDEESGIGTLISTMIPYSILFLVGWIVLFIVWMLIGLPLGPGAFMMLQ